VEAARVLLARGNKPPHPTLPEAGAFRTAAHEGAFVQFVFLRGFQREVLIRTVSVFRTQETVNILTTYELHRTLKTHYFTHLTYY